MHYVWADVSSAHTFAVVLSIWNFLWPDTGETSEKGRYAEEESCNTGGHQYDDGDDSGEDAYRKGFFSMV